MLATVLMTKTHLTTIFQVNIFILNCILALDTLLHVLAVFNYRVQPS